MNLRKAIISVLQLFAGFSFFAAAIFFFSLPFLPTISLKIADMLITSPEVCYLIATILVGVSFVLIGGFYLFNRGRSMRISMGGHTVSIDTTLIQKTLDECFKTHFNGKITLSDLYVVYGNKLEIEVFLTPFEENLREDLFIAVQKQLMPLLSERFGYSRSFGFIIKNS